MEGFVHAALDPSRSEAFLSEVFGFVTRIARPGAANGLVQSALRCLAPGLPDIYQGTEFWDFSLVDPDNRRPVDFAARRIALAQRLTLDLLAESWRDGRIKQGVLRKLLALRQVDPALFAGGNYQPVAIHGERADQAIAFTRTHGDRAVLAIMARCCASGMAGGEALVPDRAWWGTTRIAVEGGWVPVIGPEIAPNGGLAMADALPLLPVGVWTRAGS